MSRLKQIADNHHHLTELDGLIRHYGLSAEFVATSLLEQCQQQLGDLSSEQSDSQNQNKDQQSQYQLQNAQQNQSNQASQDRQSSDSQLTPEDMHMMQDFIEDLQQFCAKL